VKYPFFYRPAHIHPSVPSPSDAFDIKMPPIRNQPLKQTTLPFARPFNQLSPSSSTSISETSSQSIPPTPTMPITQPESTRRSWVWLHGTEYFDRQGQKRWRCNFCPNRSTAQTYADGSTSHMGNHLKKIHQVYEEGEIPTDQTTIETCTKSTIKPEVLRKLIVEWIIDRRHAFNKIEAESFRKLIGYIDKAALSFIPRSGNTVRADILKYFAGCKSIMRESLATARSQIHLSLDLWTTPNHHHFMAITAHWTTSEYIAESTLLAIREVPGEHTGENLSVTVFEVAKEYDIRDRLGYFMMDGATNNDTTIEWLDKRIREEGGIGFNPKERRLRCFGHIQNRVVRKLLFADKAKELERGMKEEEAENEAAKGSINEKEKVDWMEIESAKWRALGAVGKLHNIVKWVRLKPRRRSAFLDLHLVEFQKVDAFMLRSDNDTRWNSTRNMIQSALDQKERVAVFCAMEAGLAKDALTEQDWADLREIMELLEPFHYLTLLGENRGTQFGSIGLILWGMDLLLEKLENARKKSRNTPFQSAVDSAWAVLKKYYEYTDESVIHVAATVLDPRMKYSYFDRRWKKDWIKKAKETMIEFVARYREDEDNPTSTSIPPLAKSNRPIDIDSWRFGSTAKKEDELTRYLKAPLLFLGTPEANDGFDLLEWWKGNAKEYLTLARIAFDIFSVPAMSVEQERVFSG